jgi:hypothetical protein
MIKLLSIFFLSVVLISTIAYSQSKKVTDLKSASISRDYVNPDHSGDFYIDYKNRQLGFSM